ncbi:MAG TPA: dTMP kinase [Candidatus Pacearchaeota archaeon]|nr:dTMP kinase [Candidatus Pacearchaeota archaeon]
MLKNTNEGKFIVLEGLDGSGQSTQVKMLKDYLESCAIPCLVTKEPTQVTGDFFSSVAQSIRGVLDKKISMDPKTLQEMFAQDRKEHLENQIIPALSQGIWVICDRYCFSSFAYGAAHGNNIDYLIKINENFLLPDFIFLLKVRPQICMQRVVRRNEGLKFFEVEEKLSKTWKQYEEVIKKFPEINVIDGEKDMVTVHDEIKNIIQLRTKS